MNMQRVDFMEASVPTRPSDIQEGDRIALSWYEAHTVLAVELSASGAYLTLRGPCGVYRVHRRSPLRVVCA